MKKFALLAVLGLAACSATTLSKLGVLEQKAVVDGQLFCAKATVDGPLVAALVNAAGVPVVVTNVASAVVAAECAAIGGVPVSPPANPATAPIIALAAAVTAGQNAVAPAPVVAAPATK